MFLPDAELKELLAVPEDESWSSHHDALRKVLASNLGAKLFSFANSELKEALAKINGVAGVKTVSPTRKVDVFYGGIALEAKVKSLPDFVDTACAACLRGMAVDSKKVTALP
eukprot:3475571-Amphidinium_carterae.1